MNNNSKIVPENTVSIKKDSPEYDKLVIIFWGVKERVDSILDRIYMDVDGQFYIQWKKRQWGKLETKKIRARYHSRKLPLFSTD